MSGAEHGEPSRLGPGPFTVERMTSGWGICTFVSEVGGTMPLCGDIPYRPTADAIAANLNALAGVEDPARFMADVSEAKLALLACVLGLESADPGDAGWASQAESVIISARAALAALGEKP